MAVAAVVDVVVAVVAVAAAVVVVVVAAAVGVVAPVDSTYFGGIVGHPASEWCFQVLSPEHFLVVHSHSQAFVCLPYCLQDNLHEPVVVRV